MQEIEKQIKLLKDEEISDRTPIIEEMIHKWKYINKFKKKNFDEAIKLYQQAIELYPKEMVYYLNSAKCYLEKKDYDKTIELP